MKTALVGISRVSSTNEEDVMKIDIVKGAATHIRLECSLEDFAKIITGNRLPCNIKRWENK